MESLKKSNGLPPLIGTLTERANASKPVTPMLPSLGSSKLRHARTISRDTDWGRHDSWRKGRCHQGCIWQRRAEATAKAQARRRAIGQVLTGVFIAIAFAMASVALQREAQLEQLQLQVQQQQ